MWVIVYAVLAFVAFITFTINLVIRLLCLRFLLIFLMWCVLTAVGCSIMVSESLKLWRGFSIIFSSIRCCSSLAGDSSDSFLYGGFYDSFLYCIVLCSNPGGGVYLSPPARDL